MSPASAMRGLGLRDVSAWFGALHVLDRVTLDFEPGSVTALIGPSGCGKSTVLKLLNRMADELVGFRFEGQLVLGDEDLYSADVRPESARRRVGTVFREPAVFPWSIFENVAFGLRLAGVQEPAVLREQVEAALRQAGLWDELSVRLEGPARALSLGAQQRLCIARALALEPDALLLDEPTASLDPASASRVEEVLVGLGGRYTVVLATYDAKLAGRVSDVTAFMDRGRVVEVNRTDELFTRPRQAATEAYITRRFGGP